MINVNEVIKELPFKVDNQKLLLSNSFLLKSGENSYILRYMTEKDKAIYDYLIQDKHMLKMLGRYDSYYLFPFHPLLGDEIALAKNMLNDATSFFYKTQEPRILKKREMGRLERVFAVLDSRFRYFEVRIRECEMENHRTDASWILLSKYHIILDCKVKLYDLQQKMFKMIEEGLSIHYGLIIPLLNINYYRKELFMEYFDVFYGPISTLAARFYVENDHLNDFEKEMKHLLKRDNVFYQVHFLFSVYYYYILQINIPRVLNSFTIDNFMQITKRISQFSRLFKDYIK